MSLDFDISGMLGKGGIVGAIGAAAAGAGLLLSSLTGGDGMSCPAGFEAHQAEDRAADVVQKSCESEAALVLLTPEGEFSQAWLKLEGRITDKPEEVPGWH